VPLVEDEETENVDESKEIKWDRKVNREERGGKKSRSRVSRINRRKVKKRVSNMFNREPRRKGGIGK
jgi:hypothetical protein